MIATWVRQVRAAHFTAVMATGIVATAMDPSWPGGSAVLFWLAVAVFAVMTVALIPAAVLRHRAEAVSGRAPLGDFGVFAYPAGAAVLAGHAAGADLPRFATVLMVLAAATWLAASYVVVARRVTRTGPAGGGDRPTVRLSTVDGTWLLTAVAPLAVATAANGVGAVEDRDLWAVVATGAWGIGLIQLLLVGTLVAARLLLVPLIPDDEVSPYWVFMGIIALALLGGVGLYPGPSRDPVVVMAVIDTVGIVLWSFATWMLPLMIAMTAWHARRDRHRYDFRAALWSMVFPVGVSGAASEAFGRVHHWDWMIAYGQVLGWAGLMIWAAVAAMLIRGLVLVGTRRVAPAD